MSEGACPLPLSMPGVPRAQRSAQLKFIRVARGSLPFAIVIARCAARPGRGATEIHESSARKLANCQLSLPGAPRARRAAQMSSE
eukprot:9744758-Karenia_brevis.AAC.1